MMTYAVAAIRLRREDVYDRTIAGLERGQDGSVLTSDHCCDGGPSSQTCGPSCGTSPIERTSRPIACEGSGSEDLSLGAVH